ncbi:hypothetical protein Clacol_006437 [Clathrus columnatus]|uniref:Kinetochore protein Spc24 n=1 Tax=Clathrus columnatus TaxID=1419009 RepID=A0AAV5AC23_9AGAM|nr:hypothetical protein Clacol_006437 [Clathrus columnatus]
MSWLGPIPIISTMTQHMDPEDDYVMITDAEEHITLKAAARQKAAEETRNLLRALSRQLEQAKLSAARPANVPAEDEHVALLNELEDSRMSLGKAINDGEALLASKEVELLRLREEERALEGKDVAVDHNLDSTALRLQICRNLGFEPVLDNNNNVVKILVRSESMDVHSVVFEKNKSNIEYTQLLWDLALS